MFKIIVLGGPCEPYIKKCINSILEQDEQDFEILIGIDKQDSADDVVCGFNDSRIRLYVGTGREKGFHLLMETLKLGEIDDEDILVLIDADDWLTDNSSLSEVAKVYSRYPKTLMTHGSWKSDPPGTFAKHCLLPYTMEDFKDIRKAVFKATHLRTLKYKVFKKINEADMKDDDGNWLWCGDLIIMTAALEMAGIDRVKFIPKPIYTYNVSGPRSSVTMGKQIQKTVKLCKSRKPYQLLGE